MPNKVNLGGLFGVRLHQYLSFSTFFNTKAVFGGDVAFFPGCSMIGHDTNLVMKVFGYLRNVFPKAGIFSSCCAHPTFALEDGKRYERYQGILKEQLNKAGIKNLIVCCPNCSETLRQISGLKVTSIWGVLEKHPPEPAQASAVLPGLVLHDPCPTRVEPAIQESMRKVLRHFNVPFDEYPSNRAQTSCCGKIKMLMVLNPEKGREMLRRRIAQSSSRNIVTYCFSCMDSFKSADCKSIHGLECIFQRSEEIDPGKNETVSHVWRNRRLMARKIAALQ